MLYKARDARCHWITGQGVEIGDKAYIIPDNAKVTNTDTKVTVEMIPVDPATMCRFTGYYDCNDEPIFTNDLIAAGKWRNDERQYAGILQVLPDDERCDNELTRYEDLNDGFIDECDEDLGYCMQEYFVTRLGSVLDDNGAEKAYGFWYDATTKKLYS